MAHINGTYQWHTFYGSSSDDSGYGIAVDGSGNVYVTGYSYATWGSPLHAFSSSSGTSDIFVLKLGSSGTYQWHTFYGSSSSNDSGSSITLDVSGNVYVTGYSYATWGSPLHAFSSSVGTIDIFVLKLDSNGTYQWHTFYGSTNYDSGSGIAVDGSGNVYVSGNSNVTWGSPLHVFSGSGYTDILVLKLDSNGTYQWHTFYGSTYYDSNGGIAIDGSGNVYVTGSIYATWGSPLHPYSGGGLDDILVLKLDSSGTYQWHTFYGSTNYDTGVGIAVDGSGNVYVTGYSFATWGSPLRAYSGACDIYILKMNDSSGNPVISSSAGTGGTISPSGSVSVAYGADQTFTITPNTGYKVAQVLVDGTPVTIPATGGTYLFTNVTANHTISASFTLLSLTITASAGTGGTISPNGFVSVAYGADQTFTISPDTRYQVAEVLVDFAPATIPAAGGTYTFPNLTANHTISAIFKSSWVKVSGFWNNEYDCCFTTIAINPRTPNIIYVGSSMLGGPGVVKSTDGGKTWAETNTGIEKIGGISGTNYPPISKIVISPNNPNILYLGTAVDNPLYTGGSGCVYKSIDGGNSWIKINGQENWLGVPQIQGSIFDIAIDPHNSDIAFVGASGQGVYKTINGGIDWVKVYNATAVTGIADYFHVIRINPTQSNEIYLAGFSYYSESAIPIPKIYDAIGTTGVFPILEKSFDGGQTWEIFKPTTSSGMPLLTDLKVVSSTIYLSTTAYQTPVYIVIDDNGVFKSTNGGTVWKSINNATPIDLTSLPVYSISLDSNVVEKLLISSGNGIFYSIDGGDHWQKIFGLPSSSLVYVVNFIGNRLIALTSSGIYTLDFFTTTVKGDVNGDGKVDISDAILCLQVLSGMLPGNINPAADVNADGKIGMAEAIYAMQKAAGL